MGSSNWLAQIFAVTSFALKTVPQRAGSSLAAAFGIAGVVTVLVGVLSIAQGFRRTMTVAGAPDRVIVMRSGSDSEMMSNLAGDETRVIKDAPRVARSPQGDAVGSAELFVIIDLPKRTTRTDANVPLRGVQPTAFAVRPEVQITQGRLFEPGRNEVIVGRSAAGEFAGLDLGATLTVGRQSWTVVGIFSANGGVAESEIWTDAGVLQPAYQRGNTYQSVLLRLTSPEAFTEFKDALTADPRLKVKVVRETDYYADQSRMLFSLIQFLGGLIAGLMALGAVFGALNTMYTAVSARTQEIATLRALGFGAAPVAISVLIESMVLALAGGAVGAGAAYWAFDGFRTATLNWQSFSQVAFAFQVTPALLAAGVFLAAFIGLLGGLLPAWRAARLPISAGLRAL
jgi:putative ABC transport system permease protein